MEFEFKGRYCLALGTRLHNFDLWASPELLIDDMDPDGF